MFDFLDGRFDLEHLFERRDAVRLAIELDGAVLRFPLPAVGVGSDDLEIVGPADEKRQELLIRPPVGLHVTHESRLKHAVARQVLGQDAEPLADVGGERGVLAGAFAVVGRGDAAARFARRAFAKDVDFMEAGQRVGARGPCGCQWALKTSQSWAFENQPS